MRRRPWICTAAVAAVWIGAPTSMAEPAPAAQAASQALPSPPPGFDAVATTAKPTPLSGVDVVAKRSTKVSELEVTVPLCPQAKKTPAPTDDGPQVGNSIVRREGPFDEPPPAPKVVSTFPAKGAVVRPGLLVLRVTFDRPMTCIGLLQSRVPFPDPCPPPLREPMVSRDKRTFLTVCMIEANRHYGLWLENFASVGGRPLPSYEIVFDTSDKSDVATVKEAMAEDKWLEQAAHPGS